MTRYLRLLGLQLRTSGLLAAQYRWDFLIDGVISVFWAATAVVPLFVVYGEATRPGIPGWNFGEALVVTGWFILLQGILDGAINPGLQAVVEHIRKGTLDFVLLKPADAQFLVSTARFHVWRVFSLLNAGVILGLAFHRVGRPPSLLGVAMALVLLVAATLLLYSLWILIVSAAFFVVKVDNLTYLFSSIFDAARWPSAVFRGALRFVFTFVIPLAVMTTFPAEALLGRLEPQTLAGAVLGACAFAGLARLVWLKSIGHYTSAGG
ncbi:MAG: ABC-2 family transporter protein [Myxococcales bacterium]|nr:ABC-2 family transporter protein [Myxococcales bacterium]